WRYCVARGLQLEIGGKRQNLAGRTDSRCPAAVREEAMADDFRLLLKAIILEAPPRLQLIAVTAERVPHQREIEAPALLRLPDMRELVDEKTLPVERLRAEILGPEVRMG